MLDKTTKTFKLILFGILIIDYKKTIEEEE